jgi:hypothetical protein
MMSLDGRKSRRCAEGGREVHKRRADVDQKVRRFPATINLLSTCTADSAISRRNSRW